MKLISNFLIFFLLMTCTRNEYHYHRECKPANNRPTGYIHATLINGDVVDPKDFPATFLTEIGDSWCTGTVIGPRVLQLASHCVKNGGTAVIKSGGVSYKAVCQRHPAYNGDETADYALCLFDQDVPLSFYETLSSEKVAIGDTLNLAGFGCTSPGGGDIDGKLRFGETRVTKIPVNNNDIITEDNAALCFGDSGGSVFKKDENGILKVIAINSRGDIATTSYLPAIYTVPAKSFYTSWAAGKKAYICGLSGVGEKCRGYVAPPPPPPPTPNPTPEPSPSPSPEVPELPDC